MRFERKEKWNPKHLKNHNDDKIKRIQCYQSNAWRRVSLNIQPNLYYTNLPDIAFDEMHVETGNKHDIKQIANSNRNTFCAWCWMCLMFRSRFEVFYLIATKHSTTQYSESSKQRWKKRRLPVPPKMETMSLLFSSFDFVCVFNVIKHETDVKFHSKLFYMLFLLFAIHSCYLLSFFFSFSASPSVGSVFFRRYSPLFAWSW